MLFVLRYTHSDYPVGIFKLFLAKDVLVHRSYIQFGFHEDISNHGVVDQNVWWPSYGLFVWWCHIVAEYPEKTTDLSPVIDKLCLIMLYTSSLSRFELTTSVVIGTGCIGSCKFNYHTSLAMTAPSPITAIVQGCMEVFWISLYEIATSFFNFVRFYRWFLLHQIEA